MHLTTHNLRNPSQANPPAPDLSLTFGRVFSKVRQGRHQSMRPRFRDVPPFEFRAQECACSRGASKNVGLHVDDSQRNSTITLLHDKKSVESLLPQRLKTPGSGKRMNTIGRRTVACKKIKKIALFGPWVPL